MFYLGIFTPGESVSLERKIESSIFLCIPRDLNILGKNCTTFVIVKIVRNLSRGRSPCQRVNHVKSGVIYFSAFIFSYDTIHVSGTIHTWNRDLTLAWKYYLFIILPYLPLLNVNGSLVSMHLCVRQCMFHHFLFYMLLR